MPIDLGEQIVTAAMTGHLDPDDAERLIEIHTRVYRAIFCPITGRVLDSRTAHLLTLTTGTGVTANVAIDPDITTQHLERRLEDAGLRMVERFDSARAWETIR